MEKLVKFASRITAERFSILETVLSVKSQCGIKCRA